MRLLPTLSLIACFLAFSSTVSSSVQPWQKHGMSKVLRKRGDRMVVMRRQDPSGSPLVEASGGNQETQKYHAKNDGKCVKHEATKKADSTSGNAGGTGSGTGVGVGAGTEPGAASVYGSGMSTRGMIGAGYGAGSGAGSSESAGETTPKSINAGKSGYSGGTDTSTNGNERGSGDGGSGSSDDDKDGFVHCKGIQTSAQLPADGSFNFNWFNPGLVHHGPGTTFGGGDNFWQGGACMFDDLPHANLPSVAMDQTYWQDGLACGTCVEIASTSADQFSNSAVWTVEPPKEGELPQGKKTIAIVSDLCPGTNQCFSGLDMHPDAWNSVTNNANGSKLPINWRFVSCKEAFSKSGSGGKSLQVHWRPGANSGFCQVQIRGSYEAVVRVEMKVGNSGWRTASHVDASWWEIKNQPNTVDEQTAFMFRITDWEGRVITTDVPTRIGRDVLIEANFERAPEGYN